MPERPLWQLLDEFPEIWANKSPQVRLIAQKYERDGLQRWDNARVTALARSLKMTVWILCAHAGAFRAEWDDKRQILRLELDKGMIQRAWRKNLWPPLLAVNLERMERYSKLKTKPRSAGKPTLLGSADRIAAKLLAGTLTHDRP